MLNQPEVDWREGEFYDPINTVNMWDFGAYNYDLHNTEIARRASLLVQSISKAAGSQHKLLAMPSWKQGVMRQGGPADTMVRRIVMPDPYVEGIDNNPYAFSNMQCAYWRVDPGTNVYYPGGVCVEPAINLSGVVPDTCLNDETGGDADCPTVDFTGSTFGELVFPQNDPAGPILRGYAQGEGDKTRVLTWHQCPSDGTQEAGDFTAASCGDVRTDEFVNLRDQSWYNPLDISKGHRGFIDGDFVMFLYAWSPTWRLNAKGKDRYDLYVRRSFDGGNTWQTTPSALGGDGTVTCENYRSDVTGEGASDTYEPAVCYDYPAGGNEQARNITQHKRMRVTTLDPRYAATPGTITDGCVDVNDPTMVTGVMTCGDASTEESDLRDPSRYFMVFETGDNSTVDVGEAEPLDLFYGRAVSFGDDYEVWAETETEDGDTTVCYPSDPHLADVNPVIVGSGFCNEFDRMNTGGDTHSSEANLEANPDGSKLYSVWGQWVFGYDMHGNEAITESDAMARRVWWIDGYIPSNAWTLPGTNQQ
jgi:hypothetical protein